MATTQRRVADLGVEVRCGCHTMFPNRRIFLNIAATYGRMLYAVGIGLGAIELMGFENKEF